MAVDEKSHHRTFGQIAFESERMAAGLLARGVQPGDVVSWQLPNGIETITLTLALARLGVVQNPLVMMLRERELAFICRQARSRWLLVPRAFRGTDHLALAQAVAGSVPGLRAHGVTLLGNGLPFLKAYLARQAGLPAPLFPAARVALCGGSPRPSSLHYEVQRSLGVPVVSGYGMTECPYITWGRWDDSDDDHASSEGCAGPGGSVIVVRPDGTLAADGEPGELRVKGPQLMAGYVDQAPDAAVFDESGYFRTGDLGIRDARGYITVTGRLKDVIIRKMENITAREVEELLITHDGVADVAVIGLPDPETGERACAIVVPASAADPPTLAELCAHLRDLGLSTRKLPEQLELAGALPRNAMGRLSSASLPRDFS
jgi:non-ribosomal peptide synthetase component E (peptide arylation enzyme)